MYVWSSSEPETGRTRSTSASLPESTIHSPYVTALISGSSGTLLPLLALGHGQAGLGEQLEGLRVELVEGVAREQEDRVARDGKRHLVPAPLHHGHPSIPRPGPVLVLLLLLRLRHRHGHHRPYDHERDCHRNDDPPMLRHNRRHPHQSNLLQPLTAGFRVSSFFN